MELMEAIRGRRAVRAFLARQVANNVLGKLVDAAIHAPSAVNSQPWHFTVIRNAALLDSISAASKAHMLATLKDEDGPHGFREHLSNPDFHIFYHAPVLVVVSASSGDWAVEDATLAAENLMLAAYAEGLGTCWIGFAQRWLGTEEGRRMIDVPRDTIPVAPIIVGYPKEPAPPVPRKPATIHWLD